MSVSLLGQKLGMTAVYDRSGNRVPVTVLEAGPCQVTEIRNTEKNGYTALQLGFQDVREKRLRKAELNFFKKRNLAPKRHIQEFKTDSSEGLEVGQEFRVDNFKRGEFVDVAGVSIGKGFQGVVKRHGFSGGPKSHGSKCGREPGSTGQSAYPSRVFRGRPMPGQMGNSRVTIQNAEVVQVDLENNLLLVKGSIPDAEPVSFFPLHSSC